MKILVFVTQFYQLSGTEKLCISLCEELINSGHDVHLVSMYRNDNDLVSKALKRLEQKGILKVSFLGLTVNPNPFEILKGIFKLRKLLKKEKFEFIEASFAGPMIISLWASKFLPLGIIGGVHAVFERSKHNSITQRLWRFSINNSNNIKFYAISNAVADAWALYTLLPRNDISVIYNGIEDKFFNTKSNKENLYRELSIPKTNKTLLFVGSIVKYKGIDILIESLSSYIRENNIHLLMVGESGKSDSFSPGGEGFYENWMEKLKNEKILDKIHFLGNREDVNMIMASTDVLVHPTRTEGFGLVIAEALASGLPCVVSNVGGIPEVVNGTDSILIPVEDKDALRQGVLSILNMDKAKLDTLVAKGLAKAKTYKLNKRTKLIVSIMDKKLK